MPLYEYQCDACGHRFEVIQKFSDAPIEVCPKCGGAVAKLLSSPAIQFKGIGLVRHRLRAVWKDRFGNAACEERARASPALRSSRRPARQKPSPSRSRRLPGHPTNSD